MVTIVLRLLHVVLGAVWTGAALVVAAFLFPSVRASGPAGGAVMRQIAGVRKMPVFLMIIGWITVIAGFALYGIDSMGSPDAWTGSRMGIAYGGGGLIATVALLIGTFWNRPLAGRMGELGAKMQTGGGPPPPELAAEMQRLQASFSTASTTVATMLVAATALMAVARYL